MVKYRPKFPFVTKLYRKVSDSMEGSLQVTDEVEVLCVRNNFDLKGRNNQSVSMKVIGTDWRFTTSFDVFMESFVEITK